MAAKSTDYKSDTIGPRRMDTPAGLFLCAPNEYAITKASTGSDSGASAAEHTATKPCGAAQAELFVLFRTACQSSVA